MNNRTKEEIFLEIKDTCYKMLTQGNYSLYDIEEVEKTENIDQLFSVLPYIIIRYIAFSVPSVEAKNEILAYAQRI